jgi:hypothetical protein
MNRSPTLTFFLTAGVSWVWIDGRGVMSIFPVLSLFTGLFFLILSIIKRKEFRLKPYHHLFIYLHLAAVGFHQFEEYGWPGGFRDALVAVIGTDRAAFIVPSSVTLEMVNLFGFTMIFGLWGWLGTRSIPTGLSLLFLNFANAFFHLIYTVTKMEYMPGVLTGSFMYFPLTLIAVRFAIRHDDIKNRELLLAFFGGTLMSFLPFIHVWLSVLFLS